MQASFSRGKEFQVYTEFTSDDALKYYPAIFSEADINLQQVKDRRQSMPRAPIQFKQ